MVGVQVLELISQKDETIGRIEAQHARLEQEARELQKSLDANREECLLVKQVRGLVAA